jgi:hypothetical protein
MGINFSSTYLFFKRMDCGEIKVNLQIKYYVFIDRFRTIKIYRLN